MKQFLKNLSEIIKRKLKEKGIDLPFEIEKVETLVRYQKAIGKINEKIPFILRFKTEGNKIIEHQLLISSKILNKIEKERMIDITEIPKIDL